MPDTTFRTASEPAPVNSAEPITEAVEKDVTDPTASTDSLEYIEPGNSKETILNVMGIGDSASILPEEVQGSLSEVEAIVDEMVTSRKLKPTTQSYEKVLDEIKESMGIESEMEPYEALERIAGVVKSWRKMSFITDPKEKRRLFMKLAKADSSEAMNKIMFDEMNKHEVWNL